MPIQNPQPLAATLMGTPGGLDLARGPSLFPPLPNIPLGAGTSIALIDEYGVNLTFNAFAGIAGPALATEMSLQGLYGPYDPALGLNALEVFPSDVAAIAGIVAGVSLGVNLSLDVGYGWLSLSAGIQVTIDLISLILTYLFDQIPTQTKVGKSISSLPNVAPSLAGSFGIYGGSIDNFADTHGSTQIQAPFLIPVNIYGILVLIDAATLLFGGSVYAFNQAISTVGGSICIGPEFGFAIDTTVTMTQLTLDNVTFGNLGFGNGSITGDTTQALPVNPQTAGVGFSFQNHIDFLFGFTGQVGVFWQVINIGASIVWDISQALGLPSIPADGGTFSIQNTVGSQVVSAERWEVEFA